MLLCDLKPGDKFKYDASSEYNSSLIYVCVKQQHFTEYRYDNMTQTIYNLNYHEVVKLPDMWEALEVRINASR